MTKRDSVILRLRKEGLSLRQIAKEIGISHIAVKKRLDKLKHGVNPLNQQTGKLEFSSDNKVELTSKDKIILKNYDPFLSRTKNFQILDQKGLVTYPHCWRRLRKNDYLREKIANIHAHWEECIARELMPLAIDNIKRRLKSKADDTFPADKLIIDTYYKRNDQPPVQVNTYIESIHAMFEGLRPVRKERDISKVIDLQPEEI